MVTFKSLTEPEEWSWFQRRTHVLLSEDMQGIVAYRDGVIAAVCVFDTWTPIGANVHLAIDDAIVLKHGLLEQAAHHAFVIGRKERLYGLVPSNNHRALKMNKHVGFEVVTRIPGAIDKGVDLVVMMITREQAQRWLPNKQEAA